MKVIVDTSIWSLAFRRHRGGESPEVTVLKNLVTDRRVQMLGPVRQEILSGVRSPMDFRKIHERLASFPDLPLATEDYVKAAEFFNTCRSKGVQGSNTDFLLCAASWRTRFPIFTTDKDFEAYAGHLPVFLFLPGGPGDPG
jgi:predicted nucleic acid-binding protein